MEKKQEHSECPCCTCGQIEVSWSDRARFIYPDDDGEVVRVIVSCALDHSYDRTSTGVPYGLNCSLRDAAAPVVEKHASAVNPDWQNKSIDMTEEQRAAFEADLLACVLAWRVKDGG